MVAASQRSRARVQLLRDRSSVRPGSRHHSPWRCGAYPTEPQMISVQAGAEVRVAMTDDGYCKLVPDEQVPQQNEFLRSLRLRGLSPHTVRAYAYDMSCFF